MTESPKENGGGNREVVVVVDDEEMVLTSLNAFLMLETDYDVETFTSANDALEFAGQNNFDMVIADYLMPEMDGISLFGNIKDIQPDAP